MHSLRPEQLAALHATSLRRFQTRVLQFLEDHYAAAKHSEVVDARAFVDARVEEAPRHGLVSERERAAYALAGWVFGPGFDEDRDGPAWGVLHDDSATPALRAQALAALVDRALSKED